MSKTGILTPVIGEKPTTEVNYLRGILDWLWARRMFLLVVVTPTLLLSAYYYLIAADQYQSEAHFVVRSSDSAATPSSGVGQLLGLAGGVTNSQSDAGSVSDYLKSHDAVAALQNKINLVGLFRRPEADFLSALHQENPTPETLLKYYSGMVTVHYDPESETTSLKVRAFRAKDAYDIIQNLLVLGEQRVNTLNARSYNDSIAMAHHELSEAENGVAAIQAQMTAYRQAHGDIDPQATGDAQIKLVSGETATLATARAQLSAMGSLISHSSPQYIALSRQVQSLESEIAAQSNHAAGGSSAIATSLGGYEDLRLRQEFAAKRYDAAATALEKAVDQAQRQQLYLVRVVQPNLPVKALYPERGRIVLTVFLGLMLVYSIGWLIAAGVREHAA